MVQIHSGRREKSPFNLAPAANNKGDAMDKTVALLNIDHYRKMLATEHDETKRQTLLRLLAEEQAKLVVLDHPPNKEEHEIC